MRLMCIVSSWGGKRRTKGFLGFFKKIIKYQADGPSYGEVVNSCGDYDGPDMDLFPGKEFYVLVEYPRYPFGGYGKESFIPLQDLVEEEIEEEVSENINS